MSNSFLQEVWRDNSLVGRPGRRKIRLREGKRCPLGAPLLICCWPQGKRAGFSPVSDVGLFLSAHLQWPQVREVALLRSCPIPSAFPEGKGDFHVLCLLNGGICSKRLSGAECEPYIHWHACMWKCKYLQLLQILLYKFLSSLAYTFIFPTPSICVREHPQEKCAQGRLEARDKNG